MSFHYPPSVFAAAAFLAAASLGFAQDTVFVYNAHGKRDPFSPLVSPSGAMISYESDLGVSDLSLQGILADKTGKNLAIINDKVVKVSDHIGSYEVETIDSNGVQLRKDDQQFSLKLKKGVM